MRNYTSMKEVFANWNRLSLLLLLLLALLTLAALDRGNSFAEDSNLLRQKRLVNAIAMMGREQLEVATVRYRGMGNQLLIERRKLEDLYRYDILGRHFLGYDAAYREDLKELADRVETFNSTADNWFAPGRKNLDHRRRQMQEARGALLFHIDGMIIKNVGYNRMKFDIERWILYGTFLLMLLVWLNYTRRFRLIYRDVHALYGVESEGERHGVTTEEIAQIAKRMNRKPDAAENPAMIDPVTGVSNYKGLLAAFAERTVKEGTATAVCVFDIDDFESIDGRYPKNFTQALLKKVAFMMSLYQQHTDFLARTNHARFVFVLVRGTHQLALDDCEQIRRSVEEAIFKVPDSDPLRVTLSGGFIHKSPGVSLEETIELAAGVLAKGRTISPNAIRQPKDVIEA